MFPKFKRKDVLPKQILVEQFSLQLPSTFSIAEAVDFLLYNCRGKVRLCDVAAALTAASSDGRDAEGESPEKAMARAQALAEEGGLL